ncbi:MAG: efflux RND transporter periplasmic adaptor subunit [Deltaproteobacteria bacterium HGW-Deltaproteobacteria-11]|nr:MAG: efflux RND transporter periplasmic adaptor subunit [Deltaproteobacteria bacterium HGW-Deltaproteobacteria-11]
MADEDLSKLKIDRSAKALPQARRKKGLYWGGALVILVIATIFLYFQGILQLSQSVQVVTISRIYPSQTFTLLNASGYVVAQRKAAVASKITGRLVSLAVEEGSRVKEGQIIARLENDDAVALRDQALAQRKVAEANLDEARAELNLAALTYDRNKRLLENRIVSRAEYDNAEARHKRAQAAVAAAEATVSVSAAAIRGATTALDYALIRAPFDAVVLTKNADIGDIITPLGAAATAKAAVVTIADMRSLQVEADVSESNLGLIRAGQPCEIQLDALPDSRFAGVIHMIVPTADRSKASVMVKVRFLEPDPRILPEMSAKVAFLSRPVKSGEEQARTAVHQLALVSRGEQKVLFLVQDDRAQETLVRTGESFGDMVEILDGARAGEKVVLKPNRLKDGAKIKIAEK